MLTLLNTAKIEAAETSADIASLLIFFSNPIILGLAIILLVIALVLFLSASDIF